MGTFGDFTRQIPVPVFKPTADVIALIGNNDPATNAEGWVFADGTPVPFNAETWFGGDPNNGGAATSFEPFAAIGTNNGLLVDAPANFFGDNSVAFYECCTPVAADTCTELTSPAV